jgi:nucleotide-binding universal stress UspA family protein
MAAYTYPVVVGVDGSSAGLAAVRFAAVEAYARERTLRIVHAVAWPAGQRDPVRRRAARARFLADRVILEAIDHVEVGFPGLRVDAHVVFGAAAAVLLDESDHAALVVVGSPYRTGVAVAFAGSTGTRVAARARTPVVLVGAEATALGGSVLLGLDPGDPVAAAIDFAFEEATLRAVPLRAFAGWSATPCRGHRPGSGDVDRLVTDVLTEWRGKYPDAHVIQDAVQTTDPANALLRASRDAALTVIGSHRRSPARELLPGSCGYRLVHHATSPVAVVPT